MLCSGKGLYLLGFGSCGKERCYEGIPCLEGCA
jgi:hypothetical protein